MVIARNVVVLKSGFRLDTLNRHYKTVFKFTSNVHNNWYDNPAMKLQAHICVILCLSLLTACDGTGGWDIDMPTMPPVVQTPDARSPSVGRAWNDVLLEAIRNDFARPTVHARNLFHISAAMYDAWSRLPWLFSSLPSWPWLRWK